MAEDRKCPHCGKPVPAHAPGGLCPECMVRVGLGSEAASADTGPARPAPPLPSPETLARLLPQLEILELLGSGGMGAVYKARQRELDRLVALKILPAGSGRAPDFAERFTREAKALARLNHPNIVALYEFGHVEDLHYLVMEFVDGLNLRQVELAGRLAPREALQIIPQICEALQFAHDQGIVHRDVKPENVLLDKRGRVKIADFGLARLLGYEPESLRLTRAREVMGTPLYMAPEQVEQPQSVDHRADIYSLGVVFYEMLTGELPLGKFAPPSQKVRVDVRLDEVVLRALEKEPTRRYQHASEVKTDMETIMTEPPTAKSRSALPPRAAAAAPGRFSRVWAMAATAAALVLAGLLAGSWKGQSPNAPAKPGGPTLRAAATPAPARGPSPLPADTNASPAREANEAFVRRYGIRPLRPPSEGSGLAPEPARSLAARYGSPPTAMAPTSLDPLSEEWHRVTNSATGPTNAAPEGWSVSKPTPLYLRLKLEDVVNPGGPDTRYVLSAQNEASPNPAHRAKRQFYCSLQARSSTNQVFTLREVQGTPADPTVILELNDTHQRVAVDQAHPFQRLEGYMADLTYGPENRTWANRRVGNAVAGNGEQYLVLAITEKEVILLAKSSGKKERLEFHPAP